MKTDTTVRNELKKILGQVNSLSQQVSDSLDKDENIVDLSNELVKAAVTFTFHLGHLYGVENKLNQPAKAVALSKAVNVQYHSFRDSKGRFAAKATNP